MLRWRWGFAAWRRTGISVSDRYLDYSGRADRISGGARRIPVQTPRGEFAVWTKRVGNNPDLKMLLLHGGPGATHEYLEAPGARPGPGELRPVRAVVGRDPGDGVRAHAPGASARPGDLEHDGERARLHRLRRAGADARDGPRRTRGDQGPRGGRRHREPAVYGTARPALLRAAHAADAGQGLARARGARLRAHQPEDLRADAGPERARHERRREARTLGPGGADLHTIEVPTLVIGAATTRWTRPTWR